MDRRHFIKKSCGACAMMSLGSIIGVSFLESCMGSALLSARNDNGTVTIATEKFQDKKPHIVRISGYDYDIVVQQREDNSLISMALVCTHAGQPLTRTGSTYYCTLHGSRFDADGKVLKGPASKPLDHLPIHQEGNNYIIKLNA